MSVVEACRAAFRVMSLVRNIRCGAIDSCTSKSAWRCESGFALKYELRNASFELCTGFSWEMHKHRDPIHEWGYGRSDGM